MSENNESHHDRVHIPQNIATYHRNSRCNDILHTNIWTDNTSDHQPPRINICVHNYEHDIQINTNTDKKMHHVTDILLSDKISRKKFCLFVCKYCMKLLTLDSRSASYCLTDVCRLEDWCDCSATA